MFSVQYIDDGHNAKTTRVDRWGRGILIERRISIPYYLCAC